jgi:hypothetical protein
MTTQEHTALNKKLLAEDSEDVDGIPLRRKELISTLAWVICEERELQRDIVENGITYQTTGDKGQSLQKKRPAYEELGRLRDRKLRYVKELGLKLSTLFADEFD